MKYLIKFRLTLIAFMMLFSLQSFAGIGDPWYLLYKVSGGTIVKTMGPYSSQLECFSAKLNLPLGAQFVGCEQ